MTNNIIMKCSDQIIIESVETWKVVATPTLAGEEVQCETLSEVDEWTTKASHWVEFCLRFEGILDVQAIKLGLQSTLHHIPALGARVDSTGKLYQLVLHPTNQGAPLEYCRGRTRGKDIHLPDHTDSRQVWNQTGLRAPGPGFKGEASLKDPVLQTKLIVFESQQVSYLCVGINHGVCDGHGYCDFVQTWAHFSSNKDQESLPEHLRRRKVMGERLVTPKKPAATTQELLARLEDDTGFPYNPFSLKTFLFNLLPSAIWVMSRQVEVELRVSAQKLTALKARVSKQLPEGEWVSSFELLCASLLVARQAISDRPPVIDHPHNLHVACDLRGRSKDRFSKDYFGNAAFDFRKPITLVDTKDWSLEALIAQAQEVHRAIRSGLADPEDVCKCKDWFEAARHLGQKNKYDIWPMIFDALAGKGTFVNNWDKRFLQTEINGIKASTFVAFFASFQNLIVNIPRHASSDDSTIHLALPSAADAKRFRIFCQDNKTELPFEIVL